MEWTDDALVLSARRHGETAAIVRLLTRERGVHAGLARGGSGARMRPVLQPGNRVRATWRARLPEHLGAFSLEQTRAFAAEAMEDADRLAGLSAACAVAESVLPEREPHGPAFEGLLVLLEAIASAEDWASAYVKWEVGILGELGFGLDLTCCAATGRNDQLAYVSPRSGRAVSLSAGEPYRERMLPLPPFLLQDGANAAGPDEIADGLKLTGYFLERHALAHNPNGLPAARRRLEGRMATTRDSF